MIIEYVRKGGVKKFQRAFNEQGKLTPVKRSQNRGGNRVGILVALPVENKIRIGWSLCKVKAGDVFDESFGISIATDRAETGSTVPIALSLIKKAKRFVHRAQHYYKDSEIEVTFQWPDLTARAANASLEEGESQAGC